MNCKNHAIFIIILLLIFILVNTNTIYNIESIKGEKNQIFTCKNFEYFSNYLYEQLDQYQNITEDDDYAKVLFGYNLVLGDVILAQSFKPQLNTLTKVEVLLDKPLVSLNGVTVSIKKDSVENISLLNIFLSPSSIDNYPQWTVFDFETIDVIPDDTYFIVCETDENTGLDAYMWFIGYQNDTEIDNYNRGQGYFFSDGSWDTDFFKDTDFFFFFYGEIGIEKFPIPIFNWNPPNPKINEIVTFNASQSYDPDGNIVSYEWDWDNDDIFDYQSSTPYANYSWDLPGIYKIILRVTDNDGLQNTTSKNIDIYDIIVPDDYATIQKAIDIATSENRIFVRTDSYPENIIIDKPIISLHGENKDTTIINGNTYGNVITILPEAQEVNISGFTIANSGENYAGILMESNQNILYDNYFVDNKIAISAVNSEENYFSNNVIKNNDYGINFEMNSSTNTIINNIIENNENGLLINEDCKANIISKNIIRNNNNYGIQIEDSSCTTTVTYNTIESNGIGIKTIGFSDICYFHHNCIDSNTISAFDSSENKWDNNFMGNYWSDYEGIDQNYDGIGDEPYYIDGGDNVDRFPLMACWNPPTKPSKPIGNYSINIKENDKFEYSTFSEDPNGDPIRYGWDWDGNKTVDKWTSYYPSGQLVKIEHTFTKNDQGNYNIYVIAEDENFQRSEWSDPLPVTVISIKIF